MWFVFYWRCVYVMKNKKITDIMARTIWKELFLLKSYLTISHGMYVVHTKTSVCWIDSYTNVYLIENSASYPTLVRRRRKPELMRFISFYNCYAFFMPNCHLKKCLSTHLLLLSMPCAVVADLDWQCHYSTGVLRQYFNLTPLNNVEE